jgi:hypothetical protein
MRIMKRTTAEAALESTSGLWLLSASSAYVGIGHANTVAEWLCGHGLVILGLEGLVSDGVQIKPLTEYVADFSELSGSLENRLEESKRAALAVLEDWKHGPQFVDIIVDDRPS